MKKTYIPFLFYMLIFFSINSMKLMAQPLYVLGNCSLSPQEYFQVVHIASELDAYKLVNANDRPISVKSFWHKFLNHTFIHDYTYKFGKEIRSEVSDDFFLKIREMGNKKLQLNIHSAKGLKSSLRSITCVSN